MLGRVFAAQSFVSAKELKCMLLLGNKGANTILRCILTCYSDGGDADDGYNDSHHVGVVVLMPSLVRGQGGEKTCLEYALWHTEAWSFRYKIRQQFLESQLFGIFII